MKVLLPVLMLFTYQVFGQQPVPRFELTKDGVNTIIISMDSLKAPDLYNRSLQWVQLSYKNPGEVLKANLPNEKIRLEGYRTNAFSVSPLGMRNTYNITYTFEIDFKDGKMRLNYTPGEIFTSDGGPVAFGYTTFFKANGQVKNNFKESKAELEQTMNETVLSLLNYIQGKKEDW